MKVIRNILGIDPGLQHTGWGIVKQEDNRLGFIAAGRISPPTKLPMAERLRFLAEGLAEVISKYKPKEAAIEKTFVNNNAGTALKLGQARGVAMVTAAQAGLNLDEYAANLIKQTVTGFGHADKTQIQAMVNLLLPGTGKMAADAADALAIAICHAHHSGGVTK
ncbi:MAG: crossover junction endodeoxyribonuclease RuvC [Alphaproteobacteria bacterium]|nr:crossover junction endodeoxyribonuclease RuvC [Alphaproteobacteria bacterium]